jgi:hypothetical protein
MPKAPTTTRRNIGQILLRIDDEHGHHIIRKHETDWHYTIEGYPTRPDNYQSPPQYFMPLTEEEVAVEFTKQGKEWRS